MTAGYDHTIKFWDVTSGLPTTSISYPESHINKLAITNDRKYLGVAAYNIVKVYEISLSPNVPPSSEVLFEGHQGNITALGFQKDNKWFFTASEDGTLKIFDFKATGYMRNFDNGGVMVNCAVLNPNQGEIIFGDHQGRVQIWDLIENVAKELYVDSDETPFRSIAITRSAKKLVAGNNIGTCFLW